ncbi:MAG: CvpA family protein [Deltaproteobacteria bacterium]|nr:CvpA family protein [Deltaproteobacteria bacterium]
MSTVDITLALLLAFSALRGYSRGLFGTLAGFASPVLAFMVAGDWSDPVRDRLVAVFPAPDFVLDLLAPALVFVAVVIAVRLAAGFLARLLGVGLSIPSRLLAAATGSLLSAFVAGVLIVLIHSFAPPDRKTEPDDSSALVTAPVAEFLAKLDRQIAASVLGPRLSALADLVLRQALPQHPEASEVYEAAGFGEGSK